MPKLREDSAAHFVDRFQNALPSRERFFAVEVRAQHDEQDRHREGTRSEWLERFEHFGIPAGPILDIEEAFASPLATEREMRLKIEHPKAGEINQVGAPWKIDGQSSPIRKPPPLLGQHTSEVLRELLDRDARELDG